MSTSYFSLGCLHASLAIVTGAFGAHGLRNRITDDKLLKTWETAAQYHMYHAVALCLTPNDNTTAGRLFIAGITLFSGSLYALVLSDVRKLGAITPIGGMCFIFGWLALAYTNTANITTGSSSSSKHH